MTGDTTTQIMSVFCVSSAVSWHAAAVVFIVCVAAVAAVSQLNIFTKLRTSISWSSQNFSVCIFLSFFSQMKVFVVANDFIMISFVDGNTSENIHLFFFWANRKHTIELSVIVTHVQIQRHRIMTTVSSFFFVVVMSHGRSHVHSSREREMRKKRKEKPLHPIVRLAVLWTCSQCRNCVELDWNV